MKDGNNTTASSAFPFKRVAIIGLGLMGGSIAKGLKKRGAPCVISGVARKESTLKAAVESGCFDIVTSRCADAVKDADLAVVCVDIDNTVSCAQECASFMPSGACLTDVASVKTPIIRGVKKTLKQIGKKIHFISSHPMAGSEKSGFDAAEENLYEQAVTFIVPSLKSCAQTFPEAQSPAISKLKTFWEFLGSRTVVTDAATHDRATAATSHALHLLAAAAVKAAAGDSSHASHCSINRWEETFLFAGPAFRDVTRIAVSSPSMWSGITRLNRKAVIDVLRMYKKELKTISELARRGEFDALERYLTESKELRYGLV